ncbi:MAG: BamA/TamA family outer membrane protein, partial [Chloroflexi bacterium]|nr:BamA/TamA family outer membrane protein [Chloroflexota bacterium]
LLDQRRIRRLGFFREARLDPLHPEVKESVKDLILRVEEGKPGSVEFGVGYGDVERFRGSFEVGHRNLFGTGRQATLRAEGSSIEQKYTLGYKEPWVLGSAWDGRVSLVDLIEDKISFERRTLGTIAGVEKSFGEKIRSSVLYQYEDVSLSNVQPEAVLTPEDTGKTQVATINPSLAVDLRDDPFNPTAGAFYSATFREAAKMLGAKPQFVKVSLQGNWFYSPVRSIVLAGAWRGGMAQNFGESTDVPIFERFFVGGRSTVRGYDQERLGIPGETIEYRNGEWIPTGGNLMMVMNGEVRIGLTSGLGMVLFVDSGNVWRKIEEFAASDLRSTAGAGLRYNTPVGPLRLDLGCKLDQEIGEDRCVLHFTLGHAF